MVIMVIIDVDYFAAMKRLNLGFLEEENWTKILKGILSYKMAYKVDF